MKTMFKLIFLIVFIAVNFPSQAQEEEVKAQPVRSPFESVWLVDGQTIIVPSKGTFEFDIQHRFGRINLDEGREKGTNLRSLWGIYSPSNIRLGFSYVPIENLSIGFGNTKGDNLLDFNLKYSILKQTRDWSMPVSVTYYGNSVVDTGKDNVKNGLQRWSFFHEIMIATRINSKLSVQVSANFSHFNGLEKSYYKLEGNQTDSLFRNDVIGVSLKARYKVGATLAVIASYDAPVAGLYLDGADYETNPNISLGLEISTSAHAFQIFAGRYYDLLPQYNYAFNGSDESSQFLIGFNVTRLWNF